MDATQDVNTVDEIRLLDVKVTAVRRRSDGIYLVVSHGAIVLSLSRRQMLFLLAIANGGSDKTIRSELHEIAFPDRPRMPLKNPERRGGKEVTSVPVPISPSERAITARTLRRLENLWLIERRSREVVPTASAMAIANWLSENPEVLVEDDLQEWASRCDD